MKPSVYEVRPEFDKQPTTLLIHWLEGGGDPLGVNRWGGHYTAYYGDENNVKGSGETVREALIMLCEYCWTIDGAPYFNPLELYQKLAVEDQTPPVAPTWKEVLHVVTIGLLFDGAYDDLNVNQVRHTLDRIGKKLKQMWEVTGSEELIDG